MENKTKCYCGHTIYCDCPSLEDDKEVTLEEAAEKYSLELLESKTIQPHEKTWIKSMFIHIVKWQQEQDKKLYDKLFKWLEDKDYLSDKMNIIKEEFEQFKKK